MTDREFRRIALALDGVVEGAHMGHPDFRAHGRIFSTLHADLQHAMVKLTPDQQRRFVRDSRGFTPESGAWGRQGCTRIVLADADPEEVGETLTLAWQNATAAKRPRAKRQPARRGA
jgi:hypothetical protein